MGENGPEARNVPGLGKAFRKMIAQKTWWIRKYYQCEVFQARNTQCGVQFLQWYERCAVNNQQTPRAPWVEEAKVIGEALR